MNPAHVAKNFSTCIDLLFTSQTNLGTELGVHSSLYPNCHHQISFAKFHLRIFDPPPYERTLWHYKQANIDLIRQVIAIFDKIISDIISNFIPHETVVCEDGDQPWINSKSKVTINEKDKKHKKYINKKSKFLLLH